jgi:hypothetical protein
LYPSKINKKKCESKWKQLKESDKELILRNLPAFLKHKPFDTYVHPHPLTFLTNERWNDVIAKSTSPTGKNPGYVIGEKPIGYIKH